MAYHNWQDIQAWLDQQADLYPEPDPTVLQSYVGLTEADFENDVRGYVLVPVSALDSPDTFAQAKSCCAMRSAALAIRVYNQSEGKTDEAWYPEWLDQRAQKIVDQLRAGSQRPIDAAAAVDPIVTVPTDGLLAEDRPAAIFTRSNIAGRGPITDSSGHW